MQYIFLYNIKILNKIQLLCTIPIIVFDNILKLNSCVFVLI